MKYVVVDERKNDMFTKEFDTEIEARKEADRQWDAMSEYDKKQCEAFYILESDDPDVDAPNHLDGWYVKQYC